MAAGPESPEGGAIVQAPEWRISPDHELWRAGHAASEETSLMEVQPAPRS